MNDRLDMLDILDVQTPTHIVDAIVEMLLK